MNHHPVASPQRRGPSSRRKEGCTPQPQALGQNTATLTPTSSTRPPTSHPPAHLEPSANPPTSVRPSAQGPPPAPSRQVFTASSVAAAVRGLGHSGGQSRLVPGQPELLESQMHRGTSNRDHRRPSHVVPLGSITGSIWAIKEGFRPRTRLVSATPCSVDVSMRPGSTAQGCWKGCLQRSFRPPPRGVLLRVDAPGGQGQAQQGLSGCLLPSLGAGSTPALGAPYTSRLVDPGVHREETREGVVPSAQTAVGVPAGSLCPAASLSLHRQWQEAQLPFPSLGPLCPVLQAFWGQREASEVPQQGAGRMRGLVLGTT